MHRPLRKRVTRVGSGAFSIYLPKKWIDSWLPAQQERREVDLHRINDALLIVPAIQDQRLDAVSATDPESVARLLVSAYVQGYLVVNVQPREGAFGNDTQIHCRDVLRHTDERLVVEVGADRISFALESSLPAAFSSGSDLLGIMGAKTREVLRLAGDAVDCYGNDPERALHALQMLCAIHDEDVARLWHQSLRLVARIELPFTTITDFQALDLLAAELHAASSHAVQIASSILQEGGLHLDDLAFPLPHLRDRWPVLAAHPPAVRGMIRTFRPAFDDMQQALLHAVTALAAQDARTLHRLGQELQQTQASLQQRIFDNAVAHWGQQQDGVERGITASRIIQPLDHILACLQRMCQRGSLLLAATPPGGGP